ncbi:MAG: membrane protein FxsA [Candidatus Dadabacteria bacterium]|nr:membrane protein FxsA [Candidatus Dadabacteria bacterium]NIX16659.1 membrane protein FxsA [Candidatus Dadabacteria bacterium]NIY23225.1 membrane protein FxsA [Candidatus Dadabacteria bacterium]
MFGKLLFLFIAIPMLELFILVKLGTVIGFWPTVGIVILTGILGASLARLQGFLVFRQIQNELQSGQIPADKMVDGLLIFIGGVVLVTPGLLTDLAGFAMLIPFTRNAVKKYLKGKFEGHIKRRDETKYTVIDV